MADVGDSQNLQEMPSQAEDLSQKLDNMDISLSPFILWPPPQRTRDAVINRLVETLSTPSLLSKRYGSVPPEEAAASARSIEKESFYSASGISSSESASFDAGIEILQVYSREIGQRMLDAMKSRSSGAKLDVPSAESPENPPAGDTAVFDSEEVSSVDKESSN